MNLCALCFVLSHLHQGASSNDKTKCVAIVFKTYDDQPLKGWPFAIWSIDSNGHNHMSGYATTNENGEARICAESDRLLQYEVSYIGLGLGHDEDGNRLSISAQLLDSKRLHEFYKTHAVPFLQKPPFDRRVGLFDAKEPVVVASVPATTVSGTIRLLNAGGYNVVSRFPRFGLPFGAREGRFRLSQIPKDQANEIFAIGFPIVISHLLDLKTIQNSSDITIVGSEPAGEVGKFQVAVKNQIEMGRRVRISGQGGFGVAGLTLVSESGHLYTWLGGHDGVVYRKLFPESERDDVCIASIGRYYVVPQVFGALDFQLAVLDAIRYGLDLTESDIPIVELKEGATVHETFDALEIEMAVRKLMDRLREEYQWDPVYNFPMHMVKDN